jgi:protein-S-isoprenylcysteine O-methyltransferase Ste14
MTLEIAGRIAWVVFVAGWYIIRYSFNRRVKRVRVADDRMKRDERIRLSISTCGLGVVPGVYALVGEPEFANYAPSPILFALGILAGVASLVLFRRTHKALGKMWSVSLQLKENHKLVTSGIYRYVRHPMYSAFWLMALMQALLLPNWIAGLSGLVGFGTLYALRIGPEERMMEAAFGAEWRAYAARTWRIIPFVY